MKIQSFIFNWKGRTENAAKLERAIAPLSDVKVINSDEGAYDAYPHWVHLDDSAYFSAQWNKALELLPADADVMFHVQADVEFEDFPRLFANAREAFETFPIGIFEPRIDYPPHDYNLSRLHELRDRLFEVPATDCTCWFIRTPILRRFPTVDVSLNKYGWGIAVTVAALCQQIGCLCARDYSLLVHHIPGRGYSDIDAARGRIAHINALEVDLAVITVRVCLNAWKAQRP